RMVQEALSNVIKHASASSIRLAGREEGGQLHIVVEDDGRGFDVSRKLEERQGLGLTGFHERAKLLGGVIEIKSIPGEGTTWMLKVPTLQKQAHE
ncbi:MAG: sensor histidine kinase, partial [bacterium]|nr:sensor histidine kinase [bacterium]